MKELVIFGASYPDIVKLIDSINSTAFTWKIIGFLDDAKRGDSKSFMGFPILGGEEVIKEYTEKGFYFINNVFSTTKTRARVAEKLDRFRVKYATLISPNVDTKYVRVGYDCTIGDGVKFGANVTLGNHIGVRVNSSINHECVIEDYVFIGPGATICGRTHIREGAYIGAGAIIKEGLTIHPWSMIGMGATVNKDVKERSVVAVPPARPVERLIAP
jgi:sugar O-acyltransferase (sialic acid O-acetyltransferase NeuD family)